MKSFLTTLMTIFVFFGTLDVFAAAAAKRVDTTLRVRNVSKKHIAKVKANIPFLAVGFVGAEVSMQIGNTPWSAGLYAERSDFGLFTKFTGYGVGGTVAYHFNGSPYRDTWYVSSGAYYRTGIITGVDSTSQADWTMINGVVLAGYQWHWSNFNMSLGLGATAVQAEVGLYLDSYTTTSSAAAASTTTESQRIEGVGTSSGAMLEFNMGYSF